MTDAARPLVLRARDATGLSQSMFAAHFGISLATLRKWEQGQRGPTGAARVYLLLIAHRPHAMLDLLRTIDPRGG